ncbi:MAG: histidine kinase [Erysipelotrichaceae bacterium]|nr:histidine kinase [Erysipelotrichaceae bacterium]
MNNYIEYFNFASPVFGMTIAILSIVLILLLPHSENAYRKYFLLIFSVLFFYTFFFILTSVFLSTDKSEYTLLSKIALFFESFFSSLLVPIFSFYMLRCALISCRKNPFIYSVIILLVIYLILLVYTQFTTDIYYITPDNRYYRGPYYALLLVSPSLIMILNICYLYKIRTRLTVMQTIAFTCFLGIPLICVIIQMFSFGIVLSVVGASLSAFLMFMFILKEQIDLFIEQNKINAAQQAKIMVLEMRPHFIYNTMMSIYYLCKQDVEKAQQVILDFSRYLRKNFSAIVSEETVNFADELEHTKAYLAVEMTRFEGRLFVEYDIRSVSFRIPPLTLQPIVENAVKHGLDPEEEPLHIIISTKEIADSYVITVEDDGVGFTDNSTDYHGALENISRRLKLMCNGQLFISRKEKGGTLVTIEVPHQLS